MSLLKNLRDAAHGDGPLAPRVLRRRGASALAVALSTVVHVLGLSAFMVLRGAHEVLRGIWAMLKFIWFFVWPGGLVMALIVGYNWLLLACFFDTVPKTGFHHPSLGWTMLGVELTIIFYFIGRASKR